AKRAGSDPLPLRAACREFDARRPPPHRPCPADADRGRYPLRAGAANRVVCEAGFRGYQPAAVLTRPIETTMSDCYWQHGAAPEQKYPCIDGRSTVCPRCCVERCPVETPELFSACAAAGHPTWPNVGRAVPRKLVCLESSWDETIFGATSVKGFFDSLA